MVGRGCVIAGSGVSPSTSRPVSGSYSGCEVTGKHCLDCVGVLVPEDVLVLVMRVCSGCAGNGGTVIVACGGSLWL